MINLKKVKTKKREKKKTIKDTIYQIYLYLLKQLLELKTKGDFLRL